MDPTTNQIESHIENTKGTLSSNLQELEQKFKSLADWKYHFQNSPMTMIGAAFGGGVLLAGMLSGRRRPRMPRAYAEPAAHPHAQLERQKDKALEVWDNIKGAMIGLAASRFKEYVGEIVPGFSEQFQRTEAKNAARSQGTRPV